MKGNLSQQRDDDLSNTNNVELTLNQISNKAICDFYKNSNTDANMTCSLDVPTNTGVTNLTFKNNEVTIGNNYLYLISLSKIQFNYNTQANSNEPESSNTGKKMYNREKSKSYKTAIIIGVVAGVVGIGGLIAAILYFCKFKATGDANASNLQNNTNKVIIDSIKTETKITNIDMIKWNSMFKIWLNKNRYLLILNNF